MSVLPTLVWLVCAETIALKTDASIIWEPPATCYQPPRISPHETGGLETLPTYPPHRAGITEGLLISNTIFCITRVSPRELGFSNHHVSWPRSFYRAKIFQGTRTQPSRTNWKKNLSGNTTEIVKCKNQWQNPWKRTSWEFPKSFKSFRACLTFTWQAGCEKSPRH